MDKQILDEYTKLFLEDHTQYYNGLFLHPEAGRDSKINESLTNIKSDLNNIDNILMETGASVDSLLTSSVERLAEIKKCIIAEKERYQDIQMLCNKYTDFDNIKTMDNISFTGNGAVTDGVYHAAESRTIKSNLRIVNVDGNGYEGNRFVYNNYEYQEDTYDTSIRNNMIDNKISTYYEYSRITVQNVQTETITYFNKDSEKVRCTMSFFSENITNYITVSTEDLGISIVGIQYSSDGIKYKELPLPNKQIPINDKLSAYDDYGYVYGEGLISIPGSQFFKITFESNRNKEDIIAYEKTIFNNEEQVNTGNASNLIPKTSTSTCVVDGAKRSAIKINDISAYKKSYNPKTMFVSSELITAPCYSIGLFANVYVPYSLPENAVQFILTINGVDYEVVPINGHSNGIKIIRFSGGRSSTAYTEFISEKIISAKLTIIMEGTSNATPFVNNIKVLMGDEI